MAERTRSILPEPIIGSGHDARDRLLAQHLLPWSPRFLAVLEQEAHHPFYQALAQLARLTLDSWRAALPVPVADKPLYR
jgi:TorA maturation chaperone TorD